MSSHGNPPYGLFNTFTFTSLPDHALLILQIVFVHRQPAHAIGFGPQRGFQLIGGQRLEIIGEVKARRAIQDSAVLSAPA